MEVRRAHRPTVRGLASRLKSTDQVEREASSVSSIDSEECQVYSRRVEEVFKSLPLMTFDGPSIASLSPSGLYYFNC